MECVQVAGQRFPLYSARPGRCDAPVGLHDGARLCPASANNVLWLVDPEAALPGWRRVPARPRWNLIGADPGVWRPNTTSLQQRGEHRWIGVRHHVRVWQAGDYAIGQAHVEDWVGLWRRHHRLLSLSDARDAVANAAKMMGYQVSYEAVPSAGKDWDGRVAVIRD